VCAHPDKLAQRKSLSLPGPSAGGTAVGLIYAPALSLGRSVQRSAPANSDRAVAMPAFRDFSPGSPATQGGPSAFSSRNKFRRPHTYHQPWRFQGPRWVCSTCPAREQFVIPPCTAPGSQIAQANSRPLPAKTNTVWCCRRRRALRSYTISALR